MKKTSLLALCAFFLCAVVHAADKPLHLNVLAIGNSYDNNMKSSFPNWVKHSGKGHTLDLLAIVMGGGSLQEHWESVEELSGKAPAAHKKTKQQVMPLVVALNSKNWDYVTLHQVSWKSPFIETYEPYLGKLIALTREHAPEAQIAFYQTWAYRPDHKFFAEQKLTPEQMQSRIVENYVELSKRYQFPVIPVGEVFRKVLEKRPFALDPDFDYKNPPAGTLPNEKNSLHVGAQRGKDGKLKNDPSHAGEVGRYLIGGTWYSMLYDESPVGVKYLPKGMSEEDARFYQEVIAEVTAGRRFAPPASKTGQKPTIDLSKEKAALEALKKPQEKQ